MLDLGLHPLRWNGPNLFLQVNLIPHRSDNLLRAACGQDCELQSPSCQSFVLAQLRYERRQLLVVQSRMMLDLLIVGSEQMVQVILPACRVQAGAQPCNCGPTKDALDPATDPARCLSLRGPYRLQNLDHQAGVDVCNRELA